MQLNQIRIGLINLFLLVFLSTELISVHVFGQDHHSFTGNIKLSELDKDLMDVSEVLQDFVKERTGIGLSLKMEQSFSFNEKEEEIILMTDKSLDFLPDSLVDRIDRLNPISEEGYKVVKYNECASTIVIGKNKRGVLYGIGYLLRKSKFEQGRWLLPDQLNISSSPRYAIRGHQLGYRPKTNAYDAWSVQQFDDYIRDLALFGANSIEIMPPKTDDDPTGPNMKMKALDMAVEQSKICRKYGLDVWMWYPNLGTDFTSPEAVKKELADRAEVFKRIPKLDDVFVPGADPGDLEPDVLFEWLGKVAKVLHQYHPEAKIWVSPQSMHPSKDWYDAFYKQINSGYNWLGGVVYGPWIKESIQEVRENVNKNIPLRRYPDITHSLSSQYPVPQWDLAYALTLGRESYNPRPEAERRIHQLFAPLAEGSISYSEGINDDVNKFIWSSLDWNPRLSSIEILREYANLFINSKYADDIAQGFMALERNWEGPLLTNDQVDITLRQWQNMEKLMPREALHNYRFQMGLMRACYDAYIKNRLIRETAIERDAKNILTDLPEEDLNGGIEKAIDILEETYKDSSRTDLRRKCFELADLLFKNIASQTSVEKYHAKPGRGNFMDHIDEPLNNAGWLIANLKRIRKLPDMAGKGRALKEVLNRENPGAGGFYDNLGNPGSYKRIVSPKSWEEDPGSMVSPAIDFGVSLKEVNKDTIPLQWRNQFTTHYQTPLVLQYKDLDPSASYVIRVTYTGRFHATMKLEADQYLVHDFMETGRDRAIYEFPVPSDALSDGAVRFKWTGKEGQRGAQVAEVWLIKK